MEILTAPRGAGKTTQLVQHMLDHPHTVIVVSTYQRKTVVRLVVEKVMHNRGMLGIVKLDNVPVPQPSPKQRIDKLMERVFTCQQLGPGLLHGKNLHILVDDVDDVLWHLLGQPVELATLSTR